MRHPKAHLSLITRYPVAGFTKTRMIPALGAQGAAALQREMSAHVALQMRIVAATGDAFVDAWVDDGQPLASRRWLKLPWRRQRTGDLGLKLRHALSYGRTRAPVSAVVGGDCPSVSAADMREALRAADEVGAAIVPATDGGFCLLAISRYHPQAMPHVFTAVDWSTERVCRQVVDNLEKAGIGVAIMPERPDVDDEADLPAWYAVRDAWHGEPESLAVVIPVLDEAESLPDVLERALAEADEVVVVDGGSTDASVQIARAAGVRVIESVRGRGAQMNAGAAATSCEAILFLHADSQLQPGFRDAALSALSDPSVLLGAYTFSLDATTPSLRLIERAARWRALRIFLPYGDQGYFVRRVTFEALGGFAEESALEDLMFADAARRAGRVALSPMPLVTSDRRWREVGTWRWTLLNTASVAWYYLGGSPERIGAWRARVRDRHTR